MSGISVFRTLPTYFLLLGFHGLLWADLRLSGICRGQQNRVLLARDHRAGSNGGLLVILTPQKPKDMASTKGGGGHLRLGRRSRCYFSFRFRLCHHAHFAGNSDEARIVLVGAHKGVLAHLHNAAVLRVHSML